MKPQKKNQEVFEKKDMFDQSWTHYLMISLIIIIISALFFNIGYMRLAPQAHDTKEWRWAAEQSMNYNHHNSDNALWTDNLFAGMPTYVINFPAKYPYLYEITKLFGGLISWRVLILMFGGLGMYVLLIRKKFHPLIALFSAISFAISCQFIGLIEIGHNTKIRAIMYIPWIFLNFDEIRQRKSLLSIGLLSIFMIDQFRMQHIQISYYTYILLGIYWFVYLCRSIKEKKIVDYAIFTGLFCISLVITVMAVANPYLSISEYSNVSIRGGSGLSPEYATGWSFGIGEVLSFFIPNIYGGISPLYWGPMPFTQTYNYFGIIILYLGILAAVFCFKATKIKAFIVIAIVCLLVSFGKNLPTLSNLLLTYLPYFNRFRVPAMILCIIQFIFPVMAAYGLKLCIDKIKMNDKLLIRTLLASLIVSVALFVVFMNDINLFKSLEFTRLDDASRYQQNQIEQLINIRKDAMFSSGEKSFALLTGAIICLLLMVMGYVKKNIVLIILTGLTITDLTFVNNNHLKRETLVTEASIQKEFTTIGTDAFLMQDDDLFRIFPVEEIRSNRWSYHHQNIGGYSAAKIKRYNDVLERNLFAELIAGVPINWNVINMLNVKYLIFNYNYNLSNPNVEFVNTEFIDRNTSYITYENHGVLPRAWFVKKHEVINDTNRISLMLNNPGFDPKETVILEKPVEDFTYSEDYKITLLDRNIHYTKWKTMNDAPAFMVISEIYYPFGWNVYVNGEKTECYAANYILRGVWIPEGENTIEMKMEPATLKLSYNLSLAGLLLSIFVSLLGVYVYYKTNYGGGTVYKINKKDKITLR